MSESARIWMELIFNVAYLIVIWALVIAMALRLPYLPTDQKPLARLFVWAFGLLALGDTGHVGFRVLAFAQGDINATVSLFGREVGLVGLGALSTAVTVTFFYVIMVMIWHKRFGKPYGWFGYLLFAAAAVRLLVMIPAANQWNNVVPPQPWSMYRNLPLMVLGLGAAFLILRDARAAKDRVFTWIGVCILISYLFYTPVILFVRVAPSVGMLMIPKTLAYLAIAGIAYANLFRMGAAPSSTPSQPAATA